VRRIASAASLVAFIAAVVCAVIALAADERYIDAWHTACDEAPPGPQMAGYAVPVAIAGTVLMGLTVLLALPAWRGTPGKVLIVLGLLGVLFVAWFGIHGITADAAPQIHCGG